VVRIDGLDFVSCARSHQHQNAYGSVSFSGSTTFSNNSCSYSGGGGVKVLDHSSVMLIGSTTFNSNSASADGSGVHVDSSSTVSFNGSTIFSNNSASQDGGGVYAIGTEVTFSGTIISARFGRGIDEPHSPLNLPGSNILNANSAGYSGGY